MAPTSHPPATSPAPAATSSARCGADREVRIGLVLYGGVSLAIYEFGVVRCFHDLVVRRGVFGPLLDALEATAQVDVIAGTSAGGINGILLAAALESGQDLAAVADLWTREGDLGALFRRREEDDGCVSSLLDGERYYFDRLEHAFQRLCEPRKEEPGEPPWTSPGEIDLFVTATDVAGHWSTHGDALGATLEDKRHRVVFHLKHRPDRRTLGLANGQLPSHKDVSEQAAILASIARITSSFPAAFPAFRIEQLERRGQEVGRALCHLSGRCFDPNGDYIDGGVLDNKPFGPVLEAIFYRMPTSLVTRKLFFVEPDPVPRPATEREKERRQREIEPATPLAIAFGALSTIPSHESISEDLDRLAEHNERIAWLAKLARDFRRRPAAAQREVGGVYHATRVEALARSLVADEDDAPSVASAPADPLLREWLDDAARHLATKTLGELDDVDVEFQTRRAFHVLYGLYLELGSAAPSAEPTGGDSSREQAVRNALLAVGRVVKALKLIRQLLFDLRCSRLGLVRKRTGGASLPEAEDVHAHLRAFFDARHWERLRELLEADVPTDRPLRARSEYLPSEALSEILATQRSRIEHWQLADPTAAPASILGAIAAALDRFGRSSPYAEGFAAFDSHLYPLAFAAGLHELDRVDLVRVSPLDACMGLSEGVSARDKVAGDEVAHFAAFLRRDWRSNDILWGRIDGVERIVLGLLDPPTRRRLRMRAGAVASAFSEAMLACALPGCASSFREAVAARWKDLIAAWVADPEGEPEADLVLGGGPEARFVQALVRAGQEEAAAEELRSVLESLRYQELKWGRLRRDAAKPGETSAASRGEEGESRVDPDASDPLLECEARREAEDDLRRLHGSPGEAFRDLQLGKQLVSEAVPADIIGEYATRSYVLLWGMLQRSLGGIPGGLLRRRRVRALLLDPMRFANWIFTGLRSNAAATAFVASAVPALLLGALAASILAKEGGYALAVAIGLLAYLRFVVGGLPPVHRRRVWLRLLFASAACVIATAFVVGALELGDVAWTTIQTRWPR